jgi:hypothetical protein
MSVLNFDLDCSGPHSLGRSLHFVKKTLDYRVLTY